MMAINQGLVRIAGEDSLFGFDYIMNMNGVGIVIYLVAAVSLLIGSVMLSPGPRKAAVPGSPASEE